MTAEELKAYGRVWMLERAAICEFEAGFTRDEAEAMAVEQWRRLRRIDPDLEIRGAA